MNTVAEDYIWQAILDSEHSDDLQYMDDELRIKREAIRLARLRRTQSVAASDESGAKTTINPVPAR